MKILCTDTMKLKVSNITSFFFFFFCLIKLFFKVVKNINELFNKMKLYYIYYTKVKAISSVIEKLLIMVSVLMNGLLMKKLYKELKILGNFFISS